MIGIIVAIIRFPIESPLGPLVLPFKPKISSLPPRLQSAAR